MSGIFATLGFTTPWLLWALLPLPLIWLLLRVMPPAPVLRRFPGVVLLLGLADQDASAARTPPWLLALRVLALMLAVVGFAGPVLNPQAVPEGRGPLLILADAGWADAADWDRRRGQLQAALDRARLAGRPVAWRALTGDLASPVVFTAGDDLAGQLAAAQPAAWEPADGEMAEFVMALPDGAFDTVWLSDGVERPARAVLVKALLGHGAVVVQESPARAFALRPPEVVDGKLRLTVLRAGPGSARRVEVLVLGLDPAGIERELARQSVTFAAGDSEREVRFDLPPELRNRVTRFQLSGVASAGAVVLADDGLKRRKVALVDGGSVREGLDLLSPAHYLRQALKPTTDLIEGTLADLLPAAPDVVILADVARLQQDDADRLADWVDQGGLLLRFAGPRLAASLAPDMPVDPLLPVPLRPGDRAIGGAMSWGAPQGFSPFPEGSPFAGLVVPGDVTVSAQVLAQPSPELSGHVIAALADGTPLVTRAKMGSGQVVLFHVSANAEWTSLPLSGLFVQMLDRLAISSRPGKAEAAALAGTVWQADRVMDGFGHLAQAGGLAGVAGEDLGKELVGPLTPPGLYRSDDRHMALNVMAADRALAPAVWPVGVRVEGLAEVAERPLKGGVLAAALALLIADIVATLVLSGRLGGLRRAGALIVALAVAGLGVPQGARAQEAERLVAASDGMALAYVETGNAQLDEISKAGLFGLSVVLTQRTTVEPADPFAVDLDRDELSVFAFLYWPITPDQPTPSLEAYRKLNRFLQSGGMILFDTRDADLAGGAVTPEGQRLQELAAGLDIPALDPIPQDHVLTRSFYLLEDFPGRFAGAPVWAEAAPATAEKAEGMPFRNLNDGVTPVVIGGNDWAAAWAMDDQGRAMFRVGRGQVGERQREMAYRFGVNLIMHVLTGNYKSDQVHVPALLERLGQ